MSSPSRAWLAAIALVVACGRGDAPRATQRTAAPADAGQTSDRHGGSSGNVAAPPVSRTVAPQQMITAIVPSWTATSAELRLWEREGDRWTLRKGPWPAVIGSTGAAWGIGVHGPPPPGRKGPVKREGDGKSPAGKFRIRPQLYGYAASAPTTKLEYRQVDASWKCVDDPRSKHYNRIVDARTVTKDWSSAEDMRRDDALYTWVLEIEHNGIPMAGSGSCIFLHVWGGAKSATAGCTALDETQLRELIEALDGEKSPYFVLLPRAEYDALVRDWDLPPAS